MCILIDISGIILRLAFCTLLFFSFLRSGYVNASLIVQLVKNPPAMQETLVQFLDWEDPLEKG